MTLSTDLTAPGAFGSSEIHLWRAELGEGGRAAARRTLRDVLGRYLERDPSQIELWLGARGKPALADPRAALRFNLSHSGETMLLAVAWGREVGVDLERVKPRRELLPLSRRALDPAAAAAVKAAPPGARLRAFYEAWARREAIGKCLGVGLGALPPERRVAVGAVEAGPGFAAAVAVEAGALPPLRYFEAGQTVARWAATT